MSKLVSWDGRPHDKTKLLIYMEDGNLVFASMDAHLLIVNYSIQPLLFLPDLKVLSSSSVTRMLHIL